jgi:hypothetical protein
MTDIDHELLCLAWHEAAHCVAIHRRGWEVGPVTVKGGAAAAGCAAAKEARPEPADFDSEAPFCTWPDQYVRYQETCALVALAGPAGGALYWQYADVNAVEAVLTATRTIVVELPEPTEAEHSWAVRVVELEYPSDTQQAEAAARMAFPSRDFAARYAWLTYMEASAAALVRANVVLVGQLAARLAVEGTLSAEAVRLLLTGRSRLAVVPDAG